MINFFSSLRFNIRFYVLVICFIFSIIIYQQILTSIPSTTLQTIRLDEMYGFVSLILLYIALLIGPFCYVFKTFPFAKQLVKARRAIGVSAFYFALLHTYVTFFKQLGGFSGLSFLDTKYLVALSFGFIGLLILFILTVTSVDVAVEKMQFKNWKLLHRLVYLGAVVILFHAFMLGAHFGDLSNIISQIAFFAISFLLILEVPRIEKWLTKKPTVSPFSITPLCTLFLLAGIYFFIISPDNKQNQKFSFNIHADHKLLAKNAISALQGDRTIKYKIDFSKPDIIESNQDTQLSFAITDAKNGKRITLYRLFYEKPIHIIIVDDQLKYFHHEHPTQQGNRFDLTTQFPHEGTYHIYTLFQPWNAIEQQIPLVASVGKMEEKQRADQSPEKDLTKKVGEYEVTLNTHGELNAVQMSLGNQIISITVADATTKKPITTLKPYLGAFGHMTMINEKDYSFLHIHPASLTTPKPDETSGPTVDFLPIGIYGKFSPGIYRVFTELNPDGRLITVDFTVKIR